MAVFPTAVATFTTKTVTTVIEPNDVNALQNEITAIESDLLLFGHDLKFTDATYDIGKTGATRPRDLFLSRNLSVGGNSNIAGGEAVVGALSAASLSIPGTSVLTNVTAGTIAVSNLQAVGQVTAAGAAIVSPSTITGNLDNYNPTGLAGARILRLAATGSGPYNLNGLVAQPGAFLILSNQGSITIDIVDEATSSTSTNRFLTPGGTPFALQSGASVEIFYDPIDTRWIVVSH
jgi:hypothetical protein